MRLSNPATSRLHWGDAIVLNGAEMHGQMGMDAGPAVPAAHGACGVGGGADIEVELGKTEITTEI